MGLCSKNDLLQSLLRLCDERLIGNAAQKEKLIHNALKTVCVLIKRTPPTHSDRYIYISFFLIFIFSWCAEI